MKKTGLPYIFILTLFIGILVQSFAENEDPKSLTEKGNIYASLENSAGLDFTRNVSNDALYSRSVASALALTLTYFVVTNHALMFGLEYDRNQVITETSNAYRNITRTKILLLGYQYAHQLTPSLALYGALQFGLGAARDYLKYFDAQDGNDNTALRTAAKIELGAYLLPVMTLPFLLQSRFGYSINNKKFDTRSERISGFYLSAAIVASLTCNSFYCHNPNLSRMVNPYAAGLLFISTGLSPFLQFGRQTTSYNDAAEYYDNLFNAGLRLAVGYYFIKYVAAMAELNMNRESSENPDTGYKNINSGTRLALGARANFPVETFLTHLFAQALFGIGRQLDQYGSDSNGSENKDRLTYLSFGLGYNLFLTPYVALTSILFYDINRYTNLASNIISRHATLGIRLLLAFYMYNSMQNIN